MGVGGGVALAILGNSYRFREQFDYNQIPLSRRDRKTLLRIPTATNPRPSFRSLPPTTSPPKSTAPSPPTFLFPQSPIRRYFCHLCPPWLARFLFLSVI